MPRLSRPLKVPEEQSLPACQSPPSSDAHPNADFLVSSPGRSYMGFLESVKIHVPKTALPTSRGQVETTRGHQLLLCQEGLRRIWGRTPNTTDAPNERILSQTSLHEDVAI